MVIYIRLHCNCVICYWFYTLTRVINRYSKWSSSTDAFRGHQRGMGVPMRRKNVIGITRVVVVARACASVFVCVRECERKAARRCSVVVGQHSGVVAGGDVAAVVRERRGAGPGGRYRRLCASPSTDFHFPSVTPPRSGSGRASSEPSQPPDDSVS